MLCIIRQIIIRYRLWLALHLIFLGLAVWSSTQRFQFGSRNFWNSYFELCPLLPLASLLLILFCWGYGFLGAAKGKHKRAPDASMRPWELSALGLAIVTWLGFIVVLALHHWPAGALPQAIRAFVALLGFGIIAFFIGKSMRDLARWGWLVPACLSSGWYFGGSISRVRDMSDLVDKFNPDWWHVRDTAGALLAISLTSLALLAGSLGIVYWHSRKVLWSRLAYLILIPVAMFPAILEIHLTEKYERAEHAETYQPLTDLPPSLAGRMELTSSEDPIFVEPNLQEHKGTTWQIIIPWSSPMLDDPTACWLGGFQDYSSGRFWNETGAALNRNEWTLNLIRFPASNGEIPKPLVLNLRYSPRTRRSVGSGATSLPPPPSKLRIKGKIGMFIDRPLFSAPATAAMPEVVQDGEIRLSRQKCFIRDHEDPHKSTRTLNSYWQTDAWGPCQILDGTKDVLFTTARRKPWIYYSVILSRGELQTMPFQVCHYPNREPEPEWKYNYSSWDAFHQYSTMPLGWAFPKPASEAEWETLMSQCTIHFYKNIERYEAYVEIIVNLH